MVNDDLLRRESDLLGSSVVWMHWEAKSHEIVASKWRFSGNRKVRLLDEIGDQWYWPKPLNPEDCRRTYEL